MKKFTYFRLDNIKIYNGDNLEVLKSLNLDL